MPTSATPFDQLQETLANQGEDAALEMLISQLRETKQYHELFEALKMQARRRIGLPLMYTDRGDDLDPALRDKLEDGLIACCREVGNLLLDAGRVREAWMYLRPVGDKTEVARRMAQIEPDEDNIDELIDVTLHEGVDPGRGFGLLLDNYGCCNAITTYESEIVRRPLPERRSAAGQLVSYLHKELLATVKADVSQQEGTDPKEDTLRELLATRDWLLSEHSYHIDTTHLAAAVRAGRICEDPEVLRTALDLTEYGVHLHPNFQYQGEEPFTSIHSSHRLLYRALLGENVDEALAFFKERADTVDAHTQGTGAIEIYVWLLDRIGRPAEALAISLEKIPPGTHVQGLAPSVMELCQHAGDYSQLLEFCRQREDLLGFAMSLMCGNAAGK